MGVGKRISGSCYSCMYIKMARYYGAYPQAFPRSVFRSLAVEKRALPSQPFSQPWKNAPFPLSFFRSRGKTQGLGIGEGSGYEKHVHVRT